MFAATFQNKKVWLSGATGFKGSWLSQWLLQLGATVHGFSLPPATTPSLFEQLQLKDRIHHDYGDIRDPKLVRRSLAEAAPDFVFHLAAQSLVRQSYLEPETTFATNIMGTVHVLEAVRHVGKPCALVIVTSDKCYENREWLYAYREDDPLGGYDPYSSSKAGAELVTSAYRRSFLAAQGVRVASARAGNVIGGGDWAAHRIVPDSIRALVRGEAIPVRNKTATRPWQHVLEPLSGYLWLAAVLARPELAGFDSHYYCSAFNFGPNPEGHRTVRDLVEVLLKYWPGRWEDHSELGTAHEAGQLALSIDKARALLQWAPAWTFPEAAKHTVEWYREVSLSSDPTTARKLTVRQIDDYVERAKQRELLWSRRES